MAKKIIFLLVLLFVLITASVTAFAAGTDTTAPESGFTEDKVLLEVPPVEEDVINYEEEYSSLFFNQEQVSTENTIVNVKLKADGSSINPLRYIALGTVIQNEDGAFNSADNAVIILMYIKVDDIYQPLLCVDSKEDTATNKIEGSRILCSKVDLRNLGPDKVNDVRIIAFRVKDAEMLTFKNIQIINLQVVARKNNIIAVPFIVNTVMNALELK